MQYDLMPMGRANSTQALAGRPLLTWAGAKNWLAPYLVPRLLPLLKDRWYVEPFAGSAAVFLALRRAGWRGAAVLADLNPDLIGLYEEVKKDAGAVWNLLHCMEIGRSHGEKDHYAAMRRLFNSKDEKDPGPWRAATMIYLSRYGFNGVWRVNSRGKHNVAWGGIKPCLVERSILEEWQLALQNTILLCGSWRQTLDATASYKRVIYADPPYDGCEKELYVGALGAFHHGALAEALAEQKDDRVFLSYMKTDAIEKLYSGWNCEETKLRHQVANTALSRRSRTECLFWREPYVVAKKRFSASK